MKIPFTKHQDEDGIYFCDPGMNAPHRFTTRTGKPSGNVISANQIHSDIILYVAGDGSYTADGLMTDKPGLAVGIRTADCVPILMYDKKSNMVSAVHAGWRGTAAGIALRACEKMFSFGASAESIRIAIGPSVCFDCYEVKEDFRDAVSRGLGSQLCGRYVYTCEKDKKLHADVAGINAELLRQAGIPDEHIAESGLCTYCMTGFFYSYRRDGTLKGCQWNIVCVPETE